MGPLELNDLRPDEIVVEVGRIDGGATKVSQKQVEKPKICKSYTAPGETTVMLEDS